MPLSDTIKTLIRNAWDDGYPCLLASSGREGPNITPKGSMIVFDDAHLAYWERSKRAVLDNLAGDKRVCVMYANFKAQRDGVLESGFLRFFGSVELHESGPLREKIFSMLLPREQTHAGAEAGIVAPARMCPARVALFGAGAERDHVGAPLRSARAFERDVERK